MYQEKYDQLLKQIDEVNCRKISKTELSTGNFQIKSQISFRKEPTFHGDLLLSSFDSSSNSKTYETVGKNWREVLSPNDVVIFPWIMCINRGRYQLILYEDYAFLSNDFATTWKRLSPYSSLTCGDISEDGQNIVLCKTDGSLLYSVNEGSSWTEITSLPNFQHGQCFLYQKYDAIVVGYKGKDGIYVYMNSQVYNYATGHDCTYISKISDDNILISSDTSGLYCFDLSNLQLETISVNGFNNAIGSGNCLLTKSEYGISISLNFGNTWNDFTFEERIMNVAISENLSEIIISTEKGSVLKSTTRGESFNKIADIVPNPRLELSPILIGINSSGQYITLLCPHEIVSSLNFGVDFANNTNFLSNREVFFNSFYDCFFGERTPILAARDNFAVLCRHLTLFISVDFCKSWRYAMNMGILSPILAASVDSSNAILISSRFIYFISEYGRMNKRIPIPFEENFYYCSLYENTIMIASRLRIASWTKEDGWKSVYEFSEESDIVEIARDQTKIAYCTYNYNNSISALYTSSNSGSSFNLIGTIPKKLIGIRYNGNKFIFGTEQELYYSDNVALPIYTSFFTINCFGCIGKNIIISLLDNPFGYCYFKYDTNAEILLKDGDSPIPTPLNFICFCNNSNVTVIDNRGTIYVSNNFQTFDSNILINTSSFKHNIFGKIAASENGQYQICTTFIGGIVTSNTFGRMWRHFFQSGTNFSYFACVSESGKIMITLNIFLEMNGLFSCLISKNFGTTFDRINLPQHFWISCACSKSGRVICILSLEGIIYISSDFGKEWRRINLRVEYERKSRRQIPENLFIFAKNIYMTSSGLVIRVITISGIIFASYDEGDSWIVEHDFGCFVLFAAMSRNGRYVSIAACAYNNFLGFENLTNYENVSVPELKGWNVLRSEDFSKTYEIANGINGIQNIIYNIAMSSDGKHQIAIGMGCVYSSHNYGNLFRISNSNNSLFDNIYLSIISMQNGKIFRTIAVDGSILENYNDEFNGNCAVCSDDLSIGNNCFLNGNIYYFICNGVSDINVDLPEISRMYPTHSRELSITYVNEGHNLQKLIIRSNIADKILVPGSGFISSIELTSSFSIKLLSNTDNIWILTSSKEE